MSQLIEATKLNKEIYRLGDTITSLKDKVTSLMDEFIDLYLLPVAKNEGYRAKKYLLGYCGIEVVFENYTMHQPKSLRVIISVGRDTPSVEMVPTTDDQREYLNLGSPSKSFEMWLKNQKSDKTNLKV